MSATTKQITRAIKIVAPKDATLPVLESVYFTGNTIVATDLDVRLYIPFKVPEPFLADAIQVCDVFDAFGVNFIPSVDSDRKIHFRSGNRAIKVTEITGMNAYRGVLFVEVGEQGSEHKAGSVNCQVLPTEGDEELAEIIAERFNALQGFKREELPTLKKMFECQAADLLLLIKTGAALLKLTDAVKAASPEGEALPEGLAAAMAQAEEMIAELNKAAEERQQEETKSHETPPQP